MYVGKNYKILEEFSIFKKDMVCSCFKEEDGYCWLWFRTPVVGIMHQVKLKRKLMIYLKEI
tara:strand:+ start:13093 stop:13275 length:183 start_codon:yes stop_codon:yes gene_type:complete